MITGNHYRIERGVFSMQASHGAVEHVLCITRGMLAIEDVTRDQQRINLSLSDNLDEGVKRALLLICAAVTTHGLAQVPVGSVKNSQAS